MQDTPVKPPRDWFSPPTGGIPTDKRITVEPNGRVYGYIALWDTCHVGLKGCVRPPKGSPTDYEHAHQGETITAEGDVLRTAVIGGGSGHAPVNHQNPAQYYENIDTQLMRVRYGQDDNGLWFAGALWPDVHDLQVARIMASSISGDWRWHAAFRHADGGQYEFTGACLVNIPGYPIHAEGSIANQSGRPSALAASLSSTEFHFEEPLTAGAIPFIATPKADDDLPWDGREVVAQANGRSELRRIHAWVDETADPEAKSSYKLPHHLNDGRVVMNGVEAAMGALLGARGGLDIPEEDRRGVYEHLAAHYRQFDKEPPEFRIRASAIGDEKVSDNCGCTTCTCGKDNEASVEDLLPLVADLKQIVEEHKNVTASAETVEAETETEEETADDTGDLLLQISERLSNVERVVAQIEANNLADEIIAELEI